MTKDKTERSLSPVPVPPEKNQLALIRTDLANERTLLAYGRTALMVAATGVTVIKFFPTLLLAAIAGWCLVGLGILVGLRGVMRYLKLRRRLH